MRVSISYKNKIFETNPFEQFEFFPPSMEENYGKSLDQRFILD